MPTFVLSVPPTVNNAYVNLRAGGRRKSRAYCAWIRGELKALTAQRAKPVGRRAKVTITLPNATRGDCDNRIKPCLDLLVRAGVLTDDRSDFVSSVTAVFGDVQLCHVSVEPETV